MPRLPPACLRLPARHIRSVTRSRLALGGLPASGDQVADALPAKLSNLLVELDPPLPLHRQAALAPADESPQPPRLANGHPPDARTPRTRYFQFRCRPLACPAAGLPSRHARPLLCKPTATFTYLSHIRGRFPYSNGRKLGRPQQPRKLPTVRDRSGKESAPAREGGDRRLHRIRYRRAAGGAQHPCRAAGGGGG